MIALPTDQAIRAKELKKARNITGEVAVKRKSYVENHHDDCGNNFSGLRDIAELTRNSRKFDNGYFDDSNYELNDPDYFIHNLKCNSRHEHADLSGGACSSCR
eukprot:14939582-Heterocapsa_arctica.AAC.1